MRREGGVVVLYVRLYQKLMTQKCINARFLSLAERKLTPLMMLAQKYEYKFP